MIDFGLDAQKNSGDRDCLRRHWGSGAGTSNGCGRGYGSASYYGDVLGSAFGGGYGFGNKDGRSSLYDYLEAQ